MPLPGRINTRSHNSISNALHSIRRNAPLSPLLRVASREISRREERRNHIDSYTDLIRFPLRRARQTDDAVLGRDVGDHASAAEVSRRGGDEGYGSPCSVCVWWV